MSLLQIDDVAKMDPMTKYGKVFDPAESDHVSTDS